MSRQLFVDQVTRQAHRGMTEGLRGQIFFPILFIKLGLSHYYPDHGCLIRRLIGASLLGAPFSILTNLLPPVRLWLGGFLPGPSRCLGG
ncbi:hypothetical protein B0I35DRAFT_436202 [Stachybotrys elegans]|uniref:Uncharacterized protein n=1 Tax=Stachybotrys elegans TaxID=80388 RepID=A0A8K0SU35_9HYPO|nr:hypothetical protein B0I35DRAFT_436202 [Stachybotrys elegans]